KRSVDVMRIWSPARAVANVLAAVLILAALPARGETPASEPEEAEAATAEEQPARSWNLLDADDDAPRAPRHPVRDRLRAKQRARQRLVVLKPRAAPAPPEPPSFCALDVIVPPNARSALDESWQRWSPGLEATLHETYGALPTSWQRGCDWLADFAGKPGGRRALLAALAILIVLLGV